MITQKKYFIKKFNVSRNTSDFLKGKLLFFISNFILIFSLNSIAQNNKIETIQKKFESYQQNHLAEKVFIHTDKDFYLAGEITWFKVYLVDGFFHKPLNLSKIGYVEILDKNSRPVLQAKIEMNEGFGNGSLQLPISMNSGQYTLRSYTNWMKNFNQEYFFEKTITIINPNKAITVEKIAQNPDFEINFFPEGGNLVNEIESKISFHVVDQFGIGHEAKGVILNEKKDTTATFLTEKFGMGNFHLKPNSLETYKAIVQIKNEKIIEKELPKALEKGFVMEIISDSNEQLKLSVKVSSHINNSPVYLLAHTRGVFKFILTENLKNNTADFTIEKTKLGEGISQITLFNDLGEPVCERLYFKYPEKPLKIELNLDKPSYDFRRTVNVNITTNIQNSKSKIADLSMAVYKIDSLQTLDSTKINNYFCITSDLKSQIEEPDYYFSDNGVGKEKHIDNLMLTHRWQRFNWETINTNKIEDFEYLPELMGHILSGKIINSKTGNPEPNINSFLTVPSTETKFYTAASDKDGTVKFDLKNFYNEGEIIWQTNPAIDSNFSFKISSPFIRPDIKNNVLNFSLTNYSLTDLTNRYKYSQIQNSYSRSKNRQFLPINTDSAAFYGKPDYIYLLDNYVRFTTMEEVLREYVLPVNVRKSNGKFQLHAVNKLSNEFFETEPLVLLDGLPVFDLEKFLKYDPLKIRKLEVISGIYYLRNMTFDGIANFITYSGQLPDFELDPKAILIDYEGLQLKREFYSPKYDTENQITSRLPDFRQTMYWNPQIKTDKNGSAKVEFYTSDLPGKYALVIQGLTNDGEIGVKVEYFEVKQK